MLFLKHWVQQFTVTTFPEMWLLCRVQVNSSKLQVNSSRKTTAQHSGHPWNRSSVYLWKGTYPVWPGRWMQSGTCLETPPACRVWTSDLSKLCSPVHTSSLLETQSLHQSNSHFHHFSVGEKKKKFKWNSFLDTLKGLEKATVLVTSMSNSQPWGCLCFSK